MSAFLHQLSLAAPLFALVFAGWPAAMSDNLSRFVFSVAMPAMLFRMMSDLSRLPPVDARLLMAFFGSCLIVFILGRLVAWKLFGLDGAGQSLFGLGGVFSNNVLLGIPLAKVTLGEAALPSVALVLVFNSLTLWTLVTVSVEWARHGSFTAHGFVKTVKAHLSGRQLAVAYHTVIIHASVPHYTPSVISTKQHGIIVLRTGSAFQPFRVRVPCVKRRGYRSW